jgi:anti-sigma regulatory factor (Ser/Thr protein kinase)
MEVERTFTADSDAPRGARRFVVETCQLWGEHNLVDDAAIVVTELATNAVVHAHSELVVAVSLIEEGLRLAVRDSSQIPPEPRHPPLTAFRGRGLEIVAAIASKWGAEANGDGKVVWAELRR